MKTAIAYVSDIILGRTGEIIGRENQKELIRKYAESNDIEIAAWYEDEMYNEDVLTRPGVRQMLAHKGCDTVLLERVWSLSRSQPVLEKFYEALQQRGMKLECSTILWDAISQMSRRRFDKSIPSPRAAAAPEALGAVKVARPKRLNFVFRPLAGEAK